ncbi:MAG: hypothetical protein LBE62_09410 [Azonexus sp.]|jgi:uncharacterized protein YjbI with pentapeptide repeats|nr:hypothetical protein [Azonexus sp.]
MDKRRFIISCTSIAAASALPACATVAMTFNRKPVREHPFYLYLQNHDLRLQEKGTALLEVRDVDFRGRQFINSTWQNFIFTNCHFPTTYAIQLSETIGCQFNDCDFGPGSWDQMIYFGIMRDSKFYKCTFKNGNAGSWGKSHYDQCEFDNTVTKEFNDPTFFLSAGEVEITNCKMKDYELTIDSRLTMKNSIYKGPGYGISGAFGSGNEYTADYVIENSRIRVAEEILWGAKIKSLTLRGVEVDGTFSAQESDIKDSIVLENLKVGTYHFNMSDTENRIIVKDCHFSEVNNKTTYLFSCSGDYAVEFLMERVECTNSAACNLTGAGYKTTESFRITETRNQTFILRNCKIPHLMLRWLQTFNLIIENCEFDKLDLTESRIGTVSIKKSRFGMLDLSNAKATNYDIDPASLASGQIITAGSNFPAGGYVIK